MAKVNPSRKNSKAKVAAGIGAGVALAAAAVAGAYFLYGKNGARNRKKVKSWALKAKAEVLEQLEKLPRIDQKAYNKVIEAVASRYKAVKNVDRAELAQMVKELRGHWKSISRQVTKAAPKKKTTTRRRKARR